MFHLFVNKTHIIEIPAPRSAICFETASYGLFELEFVLIDHGVELFAIQKTIILPVPLQGGALAEYFEKELGYKRAPFVSADLVDAAKILELWAMTSDERVNMYHSQAQEQPKEKEANESNENNVNSEL